MASPTDIDNENAQKYASNWLKLLYIQKMYEKYPHITSWLTYKITKANLIHDYYYPEKLKSRAIFVEISIEQKLCEQKLSCNQYTGVDINEGLCQIEEEASYYRIGEGQGGPGIGYDVHCQPSCYHLKDRKSPDDKQAQSFPLKYHKGQCAIINPVLLNWMEFPYFRSKTIYEHRVNDLPTGFNRSTEANPFTTAGIKYEYNEMYCDSFFDKFDSKTKNCYTPWYDVIGNAIVGEYIIKLCKAADRARVNGNWNDLPSTANLPNPPELDSNLKYKLKDWYNDINPTFKIPHLEIDLTDDDPMHEHEDKKAGKATRIEDLEKKSGISVEERRLKEVRLAKTVKTSRKRRRRQAEFPIIPDDSKDPFVQIILGFLKIFLQLETYRDIAIFIGAELLVGMLKKLGVYMLKEAVPKLFVSLMETMLVKTVFESVMKGVLKQITTSLVTKMCYEYMAKVALLLNPITAVFSWAMMLSMVVDMIVSLIDPLNLNKKWPEYYLENLTISSEFAMRKQMGTTKPVITFEFLVQMLLTHDEIGQITVQSFKYINEYMMALGVNSDGEAINYSNEQTASEIIIEYFNDNQEKLDKVELYTEQELELYENDHMRRMRLVDKVKKIFCFCGAGLITAVILKFTVITYFLIFLISALVYAQYLAVGSQYFDNVDYLFKWL